MMKKAVAGIVACVLLVVCCLTGCGKAPDLQNGKWELTFEDNFDGDTFNSIYWHYGYEKEGIRKGGYWVDDAVSVQDGNLKISIDYREDGKFGPGWYTGCIETSEQTYHSEGTASSFMWKGFSQKHGYFEIRCKVPEIYGAWAAFWLMPDNNFKDDTFGTGEDGAEIDIFESMYRYQEDNPNVITHAIHIDGYGDGLKSLGSKGIKVKDLYNEYHTYAMEWNEKEYIFYVDGKRTWKTQDKVGTVSQVAEYIILSCEVVGYTKDGVPQPGKGLDENGNETVGWCGDTAKNDTSKTYDFLVDYVRVYQPKA